MIYYGGDWAFVGKVLQEMTLHGKKQPMRHLNSHDPLPADDSSALPHASSSTDLETGLHQLAEIKRRGLSYETAAARIELLQTMLAQMNTTGSSAEVRASCQHELAIASLEHLNAE